MSLSTFSWVVFVLGIIFWGATIFIGRQPLKNAVLADDFNSFFKTCKKQLTYRIIYLLLLIAAFTSFQTLDIQSELKPDVLHSLIIVMLGLQLLFSIAFLFQKEETSFFGKIALRKFTRRRTKVSLQVAKRVDGVFD